MNNPVITKMAAILTEAAAKNWASIISKFPFLIK